MELWQRSYALYLTRDGREVASAGYLLIAGISVALLGIGAFTCHPYYGGYAEYHSAASSCDSFYFGYFSSSGYFQRHPVYCPSIDQGCALYGSDLYLGDCDCAQRSI